MDSSNNVFFSYNNISNQTGGIAVWTSGSSTGVNYTPVATLSPTPGGSFDWAGFLYTSGDVYDGGALYAGSTAMLEDLTIITVEPDPEKRKAAAKAPPRW